MELAYDRPIVLVAAGGPFAGAKYRSPLLGHGGYRCLEYYGCVIEYDVHDHGFLKFGASPVAILGDKSDGTRV